MYLSGTGAHLAWPLQVRVEQYRLLEERIGDLFEAWKRDLAFWHFSIRRNMIPVLLLQACGFLSHNRGSNLSI
jgi:hypothetical protein